MAYTLIHLVKVTTKSISSSFVIVKFGPEIPIHTSIAEEHLNMGEILLDITYTLGKKRNGLVDLSRPWHTYCKLLVVKGVRG